MGRQNHLLGTNEPAPGMDPVGKGVGLHKGSGVHSHDPIDFAQRATVARQAKPGFQGSGMQRIMPSKPIHFPHSTQFVGVHVRCAFRLGIMDDRIRYA